MGTKRQKKVAPLRQLGILAMQFRGTRDEERRAGIAKAYEQAVTELIESKKWRGMPPLEDQLPDEWMPKAFFTFWSLRPPPRRIGQSG
jgi:hypothetical protein